MSLENVPVKSTVEIETVKLNETTIKTIRELNQTVLNVLTRLGEVHIRKNEINAEFERLANSQKELEEEFSKTNDALNQKLKALNEVYPNGSINIEDGTIQYQPGAKEA